MRQLRAVGPEGSPCLPHAIESQLRKALPTTDMLVTSSDQELHAPTSTAGPGPPRG
jgi:hypothetical protein